MLFVNLPFTRQLPTIQVNLVIWGDDLVLQWIHAHAPVYGGVDFTRFSRVKVDLGSRGRCRVLFTPGILGIISMGPCIWYSFVSTVAGFHVFVVSPDFALTLDSSSTTGPSFPRKAPTACATPGTSPIRSLHASSRSSSRTKRPLVLLRGRGLHLRSTWCGSRVHCRSPVIVRTLAQTCRNLWWFHRSSPWTSCGYASYCADSGSDVQKTVETFHSCSSWSMLLVSFGAAQWSRLLLPCSKEAFATHSGACRCVFAIVTLTVPVAVSILTSNSHLYLYGRVLETVVHIRRPAFHLPRQGRELPSGWRCALGSRLSLLSVDAPLLGHRPQNRAKGADPRTGNLKGEKCFCPGVLSSPCPGLPVPGLFWFRVLRPCPFGFLFVFVPTDVSFYWPRASRSSSQREGRRVSAGAPTQEPALSRYPFTCVVLVFVLSLPLCVVYFILLLAALAFSSSRVGPRGLSSDQHILWCSRAPWRLGHYCARQASIDDNKTSASIVFESLGTPHVRETKITRCHVRGAVQQPSP